MCMYSASPSTIFQLHTVKRSFFFFFFKSFSSIAPEKERQYTLPSTALSSTKMERASSRRCKPKPIGGSVEVGLFCARERERERAFSEIIEAFTNNTGHEVAETMFATIMLRCLHWVKKGSAKDFCLATKAIGLLSMIIGPGDNASELLEESLSTYSQALNFEDKSANVLKCLAIVTLVGAKSFWDTERSMKIIWQLIYPKSGSKIILNKESAPVLTAAISSWSFLLTTVDVRDLDHRYWQGVVSYLLNQLEVEESVRVACVEALAIIFEKGCIEKFSDEVYKAFIHTAIHKDTTSDQKEWKDKIIEQVNNVCCHKMEILKLFEDEYRLETSINIRGNCLTFSTLSQLKKMKFLKQFLGVGFEIHMLENKVLQQVFDFIPKGVPSGPELYTPETEEVNIRYFSPQIKKEKCKQRFEKSPNSLLSKARTQLIKKQRMLAQERKFGDLRG